MAAFDPRNFAGYNGPLSPAPVNELTTTHLGATSPQHTFIVSHDGFSPPEPGRKRRRYNDEERLEVAARRKVGACPKHRASKTKCTHKCSPDAASSTQRYVDQGEHHEQFALGLSGTSSQGRMANLEREMERNMAVVDRSPIPDSSTPMKSKNSSDKHLRKPAITGSSPLNTIVEMSPATREATRKVRRKIKSRESPIQEVSKVRNMTGQFGSFKIPMPSNSQLPHIATRTIPQGIMSPPTTHLHTPRVNQPKITVSGGVAMSRGDSGYSMDSLPSLVHSAYAGGPSNIQFSPDQDPLPCTPVMMSKNLPAGNNHQTYIQVESADGMQLSECLPIRKASGSSPDTRVALIDPILYPQEDGVSDDFPFTEFLNDAFPDMSNGFMDLNGSDGSGQ